MENGIFLYLLAVWKARNGVVFKDKVLSFFSISNFEVG